MAISELDELLKACEKAEGGLYCHWLDDLEGEAEALQGLLLLPSQEEEEEEEGKKDQKNRTNRTTSTRRPARRYDYSEWRDFVNAPEERKKEKAERAEKAEKGGKKEETEKAEKEQAEKEQEGETSQATNAYLKLKRPKKGAPAEERKRYRRVRQAASEWQKRYLDATIMPNRQERLRLALRILADRPARFSQIGPGKRASKSWFAWQEWLHQWLIANNYSLDVLSDWAK